ncbi:MAG: nicotinate-nucleotide--dimethylbenzimidazole phosphoribosyltransferase [Acidobacteria bacterium]|nr:nicotinate-nucleotide--dimethylbenzimidazole phosphoribosyltransferase [Acidobacteriota bacterium]
MISPEIRQAIEGISALLDRGVASALVQRWQQATAGRGGMGRLEDLVTHFGLIRGTADPALHRKGLYVFCADHGIVQEGVSSDAQDVTRRLIRQFTRGGSAATVLCRQAQIEPLLVNVGVRGPEEPGELNYKVAEGSMNSTHGPAMTEPQANAALEVGLRLANEAAERFDVVGLGQIGVGCSSAASALLSALTGRDAAETAGRGSGADDAVLTRRVQAVRAACIRNQNETISPFGALRCLGGLDLAAMTGFLLGAASRRLPVVIDGFNAAAAAAVARAFAPDSPDAMIFSHLSPEQSHALMLRFLSVEPVLDLRIREGGGFGAALVIQLLETSLRLCREIRHFPD